MIKKIILISLLVLAIGGGVGTFLTYKWYEKSLTSIGEEESVKITIPAGATTADISEILQEAGLIRSSRVFQLYVTRQAKEVLRSGSYKLSKTQSVSSIVEQLAEGRVDTRIVTIPPGVTTDFLKTRFKSDGFTEEQITAALSRDYDSPLLKDRPKGQDLEGYIFPDTYTIDSDTTLEGLIKLSLSTFEKKLAADDALAKLQAEGLNMHQAVTLASIVQMEVSDPVVQKTVAQVFLSRLKIGMSLGSDVTFIYAAKKMGVTATPDLKSPYNTRIVTGLPPGPIANFNYSSMKSILEPTDTDYLFFVAGDDGVTYFGKTDAEHNANVKAHCTTLCQ